MSESSANGEDGLPTPVQELLLDAALLDGPCALSAWRAWAAEAESATDIEEGSRRLLPLVRHNLQRLGAADASDARLKEQWLRAAVDHKVMERWATPVLRSLLGAGFDIVALKGLALGHTCYPRPFLRPMSDIDVLVERRRAAAALAHLEASGWTRVGFFVEDDLRYRHSGGLEDEAGHQLDLHWSPLLEVLDAESVDGFFERSVTRTICGASVRCLAPTDELIHSLVHGLRWNPMSPVRWVPDAVMILRHHGEAIEWDRLIAFAAHATLSFRLHKGLRYLRERFDAPVPDDVLVALAKIPTHLLERHEGRRSASAFNVPSSIVSYWRHRRASSGERSGTLSPHDYLLYFLRLERRVELVPFLARWSRDRYRARAARRRTSAGSGHGR